MHTVVGKRMSSSQRRPHATRTGEYVTSHGKRDFTDVIQVKALGMGIVT